MVSAKKEVKKPAPAVPKPEKKEASKEKTSKKLPAVPESVLKSRRRRDASKASKLKAQLKVCCYSLNNNSLSEINFHLNFVVKGLILYFRMGFRQGIQ